MEFYTGTTDFRLHNTAVALGKFDGLHKGHQLLFSKLREYGRKGLKTVVFTFDFHPASLLSGKQQKLIYTSEERRKIVEDLGIDVLVEFPFTNETAHMQPYDFIKNVLAGLFDARVIVVGDDFHFGYKRMGDVQMLLDHADEFGYTVEHCKKLGACGRDISATMIREFISCGEIMSVNLLLQRPFGITGTVVSGKQNGRKVGMPTANISFDPVKLVPPDGVYATRMYIPDEDIYYDAVTNIGTNPTVGKGNARTVETFAPGFSGDLYGRKIIVYFFRHLRKEQKFDSLEDLRVQVDQDIENSRAFFAAHADLFTDYQNRK